MKKCFFLLLACLATISAQASNYQNDWANAMINCKENNFTLAEENFNQAISKMENSNEIQPHLYVDRARLFFYLERDQEALNDLNLAINTNKLEHHYLVKAILTRVLIYARMNDMEKWKTESELFQKVYGHEITFTNDNIVIRNTPQTEFFKDVITMTATSTELCEN